MEPSPSRHPQHVWLGSGPHRLFPEDFRPPVIGHPAQHLPLSTPMCTAAPEKCFKYNSETTPSVAPSDDSQARHGLPNKASHSKERRARRPVIWPFPGPPPEGDTQVGYSVMAAPELMPQQGCPCFPLQTCALIPTSRRFLFQPPASCLRLCSLCLFSWNPPITRYSPPAPCHPSGFFYLSGFSSRHFSSLGHSVTLG